MARVKKDSDSMITDTSEMAPTSIISDDNKKDDTKVTDRKKRAQNATVAFLDLGMIDRMNIMGPLKTEFMTSVHKMMGDPQKQALMLEFLETAREIVSYRFNIQREVFSRRAKRD